MRLQSLYNISLSAVLATLLVVIFVRPSDFVLDQNPCHTLISLRKRANIVMLDIERCADCFLQIRISFPTATVRNAPWTWGCNWRVEY